MKTTAFSRKLFIFILSVGLYTFYILQVAQVVLASPSSNLTQTINPGTLAIDIVNAGYTPVASPSVAMTAVTFSFACQSSTGTFGTATEQIYVQNPDAADDGWSVSIGADLSTAVWESAGVDFDFNDPGSSGCADGATDTDLLGGQLTINPASATLSAGNSGSSVTNISKGSSAGFAEGTIDSITLLTAAAGSDDIGDWTLIGVGLSQAIPGKQPAASDYSISLTVTII